MKIKKEKGLAGVDMVIAIIAIMIFSTLIISVMYNNVLENVKLKKETLAMIYLTEIFENVGIEPYDSQAYNGIGEEFTSITQENSLVSQEILDRYNVEMAVTTNLEGVSENQILKKIKVRLTYVVGDKTYECSMERMKIKE